MSAPAEPVAELAGSEAAAPRPLALALWVSGLRCITTYVVLPGLAPVLGLTAAIALPLMLGLHGLSLAAAGYAWWRSVSQERWGGALAAAALVILNIASLVA